MTTATTIAPMLERTAAPDASRFGSWRLGGNIVVMGLRDNERGVDLVWYPENITDDGEPTVAIFSDEDEEWTEPLLWTNAATLDDAVRAIHAFYITEGA